MSILSSFFKNLKVVLGAPKGTSDAAFTFAILVSVLTPIQRGQLRLQLAAVREAVNYAVTNSPEPNPTYTKALEWLDGGLALL